MKILIKDTTLSGKATNTVEVEFSEQEVSVQEIIEQRVAAEVANYNKRKEEYFNGLVQPTATERTLNGYKFKDRNRKSIDVEKQIYIALDAFQKNAYFILVDDQQVEDLDQRIFLKEGSAISFLKLTPLVGG